MALVDSLLSAIVRADGDALVMHVGERPYVVVGTQTINISTHGLTLDAMTGMLSQLLAPEAHTQLEEFGAVEHQISQQGNDRFTVVAARGGDDIWIEIRRRRQQPVAAVAPPAPVEAVEETQPAPVMAVSEPTAIPAVEENAPELVVVQATAVPELAAPAFEEAAPVYAPPVVESTRVEAVTFESQSEPETIETIEQEPAPVPMVEVHAHSESATLLVPESEFEAAVEYGASVPDAQPEHAVVEMPAVVTTEMSVAPIAAQISEPMFEPVLQPAAELSPAQVAEQVVEPIATPISEPTLEPVLQPAAEVVPEPIAEPVVESIVAPIPEPIAEPVLQPAAEVAPAPVAEPLVEPIVAPVVESIVAPIPEPIAEPVLQPAAEAAPAPVAEPMVEPIAEPVLQPAAESTPAPIAAPTLVPPAEPITAPRIAYREPEPMPMVASVESEPRLNSPGVVLPMSRSSRSGPSRSSATRATNIERLLRLGAARSAAALFLTSDSRPWIRVEGDLRQLEGESVLSRADVEAAVLEIAPESGHESIGRGEATEWIAEFSDVGRVRCTTFVDHRGPGVLLRLIATRAATAEQLGLAREVQALATEPQGIVLIAAPRGGGKSTLISALVDVVNRHRAEFVITLERQIRLVHDNKSALVSQREVSGSADDWVSAARTALRENPDVLVVDDLVSPQMVPLLLTAASQGLLVFVSITAPSTTDAVQRFIELAPVESRKAVQNAMAESFRGAVAQVRLKKAGGGWISAREVLLATGPVTRVIGEGQLAQLPLALESGRKHGMVSFTDALADYVRAGTVDVREAFRKSPDRTRLLDSLKRDGVDTTVVERLA